MGLLIDGIWKDRWYETEKTGGKFVRQESTFRNWITADGASQASNSYFCVTLIWTMPN